MNQSAQTVVDLWVDPMCYPSWNCTSNIQEEFIYKENAMVERIKITLGQLAINQRKNGIQSVTSSLFPPSAEDPAGVKNPPGLPFWCHL
jgi:hypothetical protein